MSVPAHPKIYHIVHIDRLSSIIADQFLWCDAEIILRAPSGTTIGMNSIKQRRLNDLKLTSHPDLFVGNCVPFYFCPRSIMLYMIQQANNSELLYIGGQQPILHLEADLYKTVSWATQNQKRWAFTLSNAGSRIFEDRNQLNQLNEIDWKAVQANNWQQCKEGKQAEFLIEYSFPWHLIERIGVCTKTIYQQVIDALPEGEYQPKIQVMQGWYY